MKVQKIELRAAALDAETSVLGTVSQVSGSAITLEACDGRTLHFSQLAPGGEISSELKKGDTVPRQGPPPHLTRETLSGRRPADGAQRLR